jgi:carboxyl-terminal processing protease
MEGMSFRKNFLIFSLMLLSGYVGMWIGEQKLRLSFSNWKPSVVINRENLVSTNRGDVDFSMFWKVWDKVNELYVDKGKLDAQKMVDGAISGMVGSIGDPYTAYFPIEQNKESKQDLGGEFEGVGIQLGFKDNKLAVMSPLDGTPAFRAGVKAGDYIIRIVDEKKKIDRVTDGMNLVEAVKIIRGEKGTKVKLTMFREGQDKPFDVELQRDTILVKSVTSEYLEKDGKKVAWLKMTRFGDRTAEEWNLAVSDIAEKLGKNEIKGVVLDLRNNPGGYLDGAVYTAGEFLSAGRLVVTQQYGDGTRIENKVNRNGRILKGSLVVLVNEGSASASEILSGALVDNKRAKIVGEKSFGKGSVQQPEDFSDGSGVHITVAKWLRPNGEWIDKVGIKPDFEVKWDGVDTGGDWKKDPQLLKAFELI